MSDTCAATFTLASHKPLGGARARVIFFRTKEAISRWLCVGYFVEASCAAVEHQISCR